MKIFATWFLHLWFFIAILSPSFADDLILQTRIDQPSVYWITEEIRTLLKNVNLSDSFHGYINLNKAIDLPLTDDLKKKFKRVFDNIDIANTKLILKIPAIRYEVHTIIADPRDMAAQNSLLTLNTQIQVSGICVDFYQGLSLEIIAPVLKAKKQRPPLTISINPISFEIPMTLGPVVFETTFQTILDGAFKFNIVGSNFDSIPDYVKQRGEMISILNSEKQIPFSEKDILASRSVLLELNGMSASIKLSEFHPVLKSSFPDLIAAGLTAIGKVTQTTLGQSLLKSILSTPLPSQLLVSEEGFYARFVVSQFSRPPTRSGDDQLRVTTVGELCTLENYKLYKEKCIDHEVAFTPIRTVSESDQIAALQEITESLDQCDRDFTISVSENYINRLLSATVKAKLWDEALKKNHLKIGKKGAFVILNQRNQTPTLYLDIVYNQAPGLGRVVVNKRNPLRFPLRIGTSIEFIKQDGVTRLVLKASSLLSDENEIIQGIPEYGLSSELLKIAPRKIARKVIEMAKKIVGTEVLNLELPALTNIGLEESSYEVSPYGRLNLYFKVE